MAGLNDDRRSRIDPGTPRDTIEPDDQDEDTSSNPLEDSLSEVDVPGATGEYVHPWKGADARDLTLDDLVGYPDVKKKLDKNLVKPLTTDRYHYTRFNIGLPNLLFVGPPGTGKTRCFKALAGEVGLPHVLLSPSSINSQYVNKSGRLVKALFEEAGKISRQVDSMVLIFLDELDAILPSRTGMKASANESHKIINEFLSHLDQNRKQIVFVGATNQPEFLDDAAIRNGRIDEEIVFGIPDQEDRFKILRYHLSDKPHWLNESQLQIIAEEYLQGQTPADIRDAVESAARDAAYQESEAISYSHLLNQVTSS